MKNSIKFLGILLAMCLGIACTKPVEPSLELSKQTLSAPVEGTQLGFILKTNQSWTVTPGADWISVEPASGEAGEVEITVTIAANTAAAGSLAPERNADITVNAGPLSEKIAVSQSAEAKTFRATLGSTAEVSEEGGEVVVTLQHNVPYTVSVNVAWISAAGSKAVATDEIKFTVEKNAETAVREGDIIFTSPQGDEEKVTVKQAAGKPYGTKDYPWIIETADDMNSVRDKLDTNVVVYFELANDIDLASYEDWVPISVANARYPIDFDGKNHTIKNMTSVAEGDDKYNSLFGLITGNVRNLKFDNCKVTSKTSTPVGILAGWIGNNAHSIGTQVIENVVITNSEVTGEAGGNVGGMAGNFGWTCVSNCSFQGKLNANTGKCGGIAAQVYGNAETPVVNCAVDAVITTNGRYAAGLIGHQSTPAAGDTTPVNVSDCSFKGSITSTIDLVGGLIAWACAGEITNCHVAADIVAAKNASSAYVYTGGIIGYTTSKQAAMTVRGCSFNGSIRTSGTTVGGIFGDATSPVTIENCWSEGSLSGTGYVGGILGYSPKDNAATIKNCWSSASASAIDNNGYCAGIAGDLGAGSSVENCYATGDIKGGYCLGGVVGRASNVSNIGSNLATNCNTTVKGCIAANTSIATVHAGGESPASHYSAGAVVGFTSTINTLENSYRSPAMVFNYYADAKYNTLYDQDNAGPGAPLFRMYTDPTDDKYNSSYHGKAYGASETVSDVAKRIGWSETIWDLSAALPKLK